MINSYSAWVIKMTISRIDPSIQGLQPVDSQTNSFPLPKLPLDLIELIFSHLAANPLDLSSAARVCKRTYLVLGRVLARQQNPQYMSKLYSQVLASNGLGLRVLSPNLNEMRTSLNLTIRLTDAQKFTPLQQALTQLPKIETIHLSCVNLVDFSIKELQILFAAPQTTVKKLVISGNAPPLLVKTILAASQTIEAIDLSQSKYNTGHIESPTLKSLSITAQGLNSKEPYEAIFAACPAFSMITVYDDVQVTINTQDRLRLGCLYRYDSGTSAWNTPHQHPLEAQLAQLKSEKKSLSWKAISPLIPKDRNIHDIFKLPKIENSNPYFINNATKLLQLVREIDFRSKERIYVFPTIPININHLPLPTLENFLTPTPRPSNQEDTSLLNKVLSWFKWF